MKEKVRGKGQRPHINLKGAAKQIMEGMEKGKRKDNEQGISRVR